MRQRTVTSKWLDFDLKDSDSELLQADLVGGPTVWGSPPSPDSRLCEVSGLWGTVGSSISLVPPLPLMRVMRTARSRIAPRERNKVADRGQT
jgi:hypothetical protein